MFKVACNLKMDEAGGTGYAGAGEPSTKPKEEQSQKPPENTPPIEEKGSTTDDFGYETSEPKASGEAPKKEDKKPDPPKEEKVDDPATGYVAEPPKVEEALPPAPKEEKSDLGFELETKGLPEVEVKKFKDFAKKNGLSKEQAQAYVELKKSEIKDFNDQVEQFKANAAKEQARVRSEWFKDLKEDPTFGGDKFKHNVMNVENLMKDFMPLTKKSLTERKGMLPPYLMRDLAVIADKVYSTEKMVQGDPQTPPKPKEDESDDPLAFYE